jgi:hypothetical protein
VLSAGEKEKGMYAYRIERKVSIFPYPRFNANIGGRQSGAL